MATLTFSGHSDDIVIVDGSAVGGRREFDTVRARSRHPGVVTGYCDVIAPSMDGCWRVYAIFDGCWSFALGLTEEGQPMVPLNLTVKAGDSGYSTRLIMTDMPEDITVEPCEGWV